MKNYLKYGSIALAVIILSAVFGFYQQGTFGARPSGMVVTKSATATTSATTAIYSGNASSTFVFDISHAKALDLNIMLNSTTTPPTLLFTIFTTNDDEGATRNWFEYKTSSTTGDTQTWSSNDYTNKLTFASSTLYHKITLENVRGNQMMIKYQTTGAAANVYMEVARDND